MTWTSHPATENQPGDADRLAQENRLPSGAGSAGSATGQPPAGPPPGGPPNIRVTRSLTPFAGVGPASGLEVFKLTMGTETIELLPLKNWNQLDHFKWTARGVLPAEPTGLEITRDHVRLAGETVAVNDPEGCAKLERVFNDWLLLERETVELTRKKARGQPRPSVGEPTVQPEAQAQRFRVEVDKRGQVHIHCVQGKETVASIGLTRAGFNSLFEQGLMRKAHRLATGVLHDWVELDGDLCSFESGRNDSGRLEQLLNERYLPDAALGAGKEVIVFLNPASSTGFDIQFPVTIGGAPDHHRRHLNDQSLDLLMDENHCGLLHKGIVVKLIPPNLVFKQKTPDGGERPLPRGAENTLTLSEEGGQKTIDLSQPLNLLHLSPVELTAVFNHPALNRHSQAARPPGPPARPKAAPPVPSPAPPVAPQPPPPPRPSQPTTVPEVKAAQPGQNAPASTPPRPQIPPRPSDVQPAPKPPAPPPPPNRWLAAILAQQSIREDWFTVLVYGRLAARYRNSTTGTLGPAACWYIRLGEEEQIEDPAFRGVFLLEKGGLGFVGAGQMARFGHGVAVVGTPPDALLEGTEVYLVAVGLDAHERIVFIVKDGSRARFNVPEPTLTETLDRLGRSGAVLLSVTEALASREPLEVVWTVPAEQSNPTDPQAIESTRPPA